MSAVDFLKKYSVPIIIVLFLFLAISYFGVLSPANFMPSSDMAGQGLYGEANNRYQYGYQQAIDEFAPDIEERMITHSATLDSEVRRGNFHEKENNLINIIDSADGLILNQNVQETKGAYRGSYSIKIPAENYEEVVNSMRDLGEVQHFQENTEDVTGQYVDNDVELVAEKDRLQRLRSLYDQRGNLDDKLKLEKAIFEQERKIGYIEKSLQNLDRKVKYSSIKFTMHEPESAFAGMGFVGFAELIRTFVGSLEILLYFIFAVLPWAVIGLLLWLLVRWSKKHL